MTLIKLITIIFVAFAGSRAFLRFKEKTIGYGGFLFWTLIWTAVLSITFKPSIADKAASLFGLQRGNDAMFFLAIMMLFYLIFRLYVKLDILDQSITKLNSNASKELHKYRKEI